MKRIAAIYRAERFSPNSTDKDHRIMDAVCNLLEHRGYAIKRIREEDFCHTEDCDICISMGRAAQTLALLEAMRLTGTRIYNSPNGIRNCNRAIADGIMRRNGIPAAPLQGGNKWWVKRADECAQGENDVCFAENDAQRDEIIAGMRQRGIRDIVVTAHVEGDLLKFYGVAGSGFFRYFYPADDGEWKFKSEQHNGRSQHYEFDTRQLQQDALRLSELIGADIFGGDCIIRPDGSHVIIDFNDWPSFSRCKDEAAKAIAGTIINQE